MAKNSSGNYRPEAVLALLVMLSLVFIVSSRIRDETSKKTGSGLILSLQSITGRGTEYVKDAFNSLRRLREIREQYEAAMEILSQYQGLETEVLQLKDENAQLKLQLSHSDSLAYKNIPARIIAGDPSNIFASLTADKGSDDGIRSGMIVTSFQNGYFGLLGKVEQVSRRSCRIRPIIDPDQYVAARLEKTRDEGLVKGRGNGLGELLMNYVRKSARKNIGINDLVITSGMNSIYPPGIYIGRVQEVTSKEYSTSLEIVIKPIIDTKKTEYIFILESSE